MPLRTELADSLHLPCSLILSDRKEIMVRVESDEMIRWVFSEVRDGRRGDWQVREYDCIADGATVLK